MTEEEIKDIEHRAKRAKTPKHYIGDGYTTCKDAEGSMLSQCLVWGRDDLLVGNMASHYWLNAFEYLWRWPCKNGVEDLKKARHEIDLLLEELGEVDA